MFSRILIANRGEIAVRIARTCRDLGVNTVAVHSDPDAGARHVRLADDAVALPGTASGDTYLNQEAIVVAARRAGAEAIHPGYGFLAENHGFAAKVRDAGLVWIGPPPEVVRAVGDKVEARGLARSAGVPVVPGLEDAPIDRAAAADFARTHGYPIAIKAAGGGGGRGLKVARAEAEIEDALAAARREAAAYFDDDTVYLERYLEAPKHLEVQILAPRAAAPLWLGVRDCSFQRRHQKLIEETPPPRHAGLVAAMGEAAVALARACGYEGAGTVEFLVDADGRFYFLEVNARLQVEHTVTEEVLGIDLVACQLKIAAGDQLGFGQADLVARGHAIECRINAEDPARAFLPTPGRLTRYVEPGGPGVRVDSGFEEGDEVPDAYDSLIAKVITTGDTRPNARARMLRALGEMQVDGVATTIPANRLLLETDAFVAGSHTTATISSERLLDALLDPGAPAVAGEGEVLLVQGRPARLWHPAMAPSASAASRGAPPGGDLVAPMHGTVVDVLVAEGEEVEAGAPIAVLEAMKMETAVVSVRAGTVKRLLIAPGETVAAGATLAVVE
ncbi:MAG: biotin carboxylase N-terminal domain-containing protein [Actinomycetota bacterium]